MRTNPSGDGADFDSPEELYLAWWIDELREARYVKSWRRAPNFPLVDATRVPYVHRRVSKKTGKELTPEIRHKILRPALTYTPDFEIVWSLRALNLLCFEIGKEQVFEGPPSHHLVCQEIGGAFVSLIEVKPKVAGRNAMTHSRFLAARLNSSILFEKHGLFTNLVEVGTKAGSIFEKTFTPERFLLTDKTLKPRSINFAPRTLAAFEASTPKLQIATYENP